ncbi:leucyl aminopeptidase family protein [Rhodoblastus acidophilus]|uniref:Leucyl aminopeptidase family protein n=1 Tax=Rhodoblastus acidophilus TaxID=1074 RepID=A0A6N8DL26_RHOAC|nr:leucyl aminopeptidase family protein [Rhodoblastus acidophilus]MCW2272507.1 leucyl aminopeptidase [Rhodoblastus acidophilus]MTV29424.1 leucyl aminopeptidase family protein [Rhodoblastus acidophilus]
MPQLPELTFAGDDEAATPVWIAPVATVKAALAGEGGGLPAEAVALAGATGFEPRAGKHLFFVQDSGVAAVLFCVEEDGEPFQLGALAGLPEGVYRLVGPLDNAALASLGFLLGSYRFTRYRTAKPGPRLVAPEGVLRTEIEAVASAVALARDLVNTPANDLGPDELEFFARAVAEKFGAGISVIRGEALEREFPLIHAVGKGSPRAPRLVELRWKPERVRKLSLVGKGVCFDSGGLDIKPESAMGLMKKDMGGAAAALAASAMIMAADLDVSLRLLLPIVENSVSGEAFRPGDVYRSRKGLTVEIGNTDAEGRLILADALALADEEKPDLLVDFATLTGAARVALGPDLPPFYTEDEGLAEAIARHGVASNDPVWRLPLWKAYDQKLDSKIADLNNAPAGGMAGSIMAALFLKRFVSPGVSWAHFDIYAWTPAARPGRPEGGEAQAARLIYSLAREKFGLAKLL